MTDPRHQPPNASTHRSSHSETGRRPARISSSRCAREWHEAQTSQSRPPRLHSTSELHDVRWCGSLPMQSELVFCSQQCDYQKRARPGGLHAVLGGESSSIAMLAVCFNELLHETPVCTDQSLPWLLQEVALVGPVRRTLPQVLLKLERGARSKVDSLRPQPSSSSRAEREHSRRRIARRDSPVLHR